MSSLDGPWIVIVGWDELTHADTTRGRGPLPWHRRYTHELQDDGYQSLSAGRRGMLADLRCAYAQSHEMLAADTRELSRRTGLRIRADDLEALSQAGFIRVCASTAQAERLHAASPRAARGEKRREEEVLKTSIPQSGSKTTGEELAERDTDAPPGPNEESDNSHEHERELVRFSDDNGLSPLADTVEELREQWTL